MKSLGIASIYYFSKDVSMLSLEESALLVGLLPAPAIYSPIKYPDALQTNEFKYHTIQLGYLTQELSSSDFYSTSITGQMPHASSQSTVEMTNTCPKSNFPHKIPGNNFMMRNMTIPDNIKNLNTLSEFKSEIRKWKPVGCKCRLCKIYVKNIGFLN